MNDPNTKCPKIVTRPGQGRYSTHRLEGSGFRRLLWLGCYHNIAKLGRSIVTSGLDMHREILWDFKFPFGGSGVNDRASYFINKKHPQHRRFGMSFKVTNHYMSLGNADMWCFMLQLTFKKFWLYPGCNYQSNSQWTEPRNQAEAKERLLCYLWLANKNACYLHTQNWEICLIASVCQWAFILTFKPAWHNS